jgi:hypothetical protein
VGEEDAGQGDGEQDQVQQPLEEFFHDGPLA